MVVVCGLRKFSVLINKLKINRNQLEYVSNIKVVAILMVVFLHSVSPLFYKLGQVSMGRWYVTVFYDSFVRCCVPLFLIISGVTVLNKDYKPKDWFINKILKRLFLPFLFYFLITVFLNQRPLISFFHLSEIGYWFPFFGIILTLYLIYPIIRIWLKNTPIFWIYYIVIIWFISMVLNFWIPTWTLFSTNVIYGYVGFPILGYLISKINTKKFKYIGLLIYIASSLLIFYLTISFSLNKTTYTEKYFTYLSPLVILMSIGLFVFIKNINFIFKNKKIVLVRNFLSSHTYGIYFLHPLIISRFYYLHNIIHPVYSDWIIFFIGIFTTSFIIYFLTKIPILKKIVG